jgi:hypothetical protein
MFKLLVSDTVVDVKELEELAHNLKCSKPTWWLQLMELALCTTF